MEYLKNMVNKFDVMNIYKTPNVNIVEHIRSSVLGTFLIVDHRIGQ